MHQDWLIYATLLGSLPMRIGINGFGRIGRLVFRALWNRPGIELVQINDPGGDAAAGAHLLEFDSVHGRWNKAVDRDSDGEGFSIDGHLLSWSQHRHPTDVPWQAFGVEMVLEASGRFKTPETLCGYFDRCGLKRVGWWEVQDGDKGVRQAARVSITADRLWDCRGIHLVCCR